MIIKRKHNLTPVKDFTKNVHPLVRYNEVVEEIYENNELVGWEIKFLKL